MKYFKFILYMLLIQSFSTCKRISIVGPDSILGVFYFNSFESTEDADDWQGIMPEMFVEEPAPHGGDKSLLIGGGCIQPTASITFPKLEHTTSLKLSCWGKVREEHQSGVLILSAIDEAESLQSISITLQGNEWKHYESEGILLCPSGKQLRLEIMIGGIVGASMYLDRLTIERVQ